MATWEQCDAVEHDAAKMSGAWVFCGTRVPVATLFENLRDGATIGEFLEWFPGVERSQVESVLEHEAASAAGASLR
ncbi:MAG: DUF433 domain-containing protein [Pirellulales bacterium]